MVPWNPPPSRLGSPVVEPRGEWPPRIRPDGGRGPTADHVFEPSPRRGGAAGPPARRRRGRAALPAVPAVRHELAGRGSALSLRGGAGRRHRPRAGQLRCRRAIRPAAAACDPVDRERLDLARKPGASGRPHLDDRRGDLARRHRCATRRASSPHHLRHRPHDPDSNGKRNPHGNPGRHLGAAPRGAEPSPGAFAPASRQQLAMQQRAGPEQLARGAGDPGPAPSRAAAVRLRLPAGRFCRKHSAQPVSERHHERDVLRVRGRGTRGRGRRDRLGAGRHSRQRAAGRRPDPHAGAADQPDQPGKLAGAGPGQRPLRVLRAPRPRVHSRPSGRARGARDRARQAGQLRQQRGTAPALSRG